MPDGSTGRYARTAAPVLVLREPRIRLEHRNARDVALHILADRFGDVPVAREDDGLFDFQRDAVARARDILSRRRGVLVADGVGLGKTHVAAALVREAVADGESVTIVAPAALRRHWRAVIGECDAAWLSYDRLSRTGGRGENGLVVLDEAHALRNPATRRYVAAAHMCAGARVVLLTATPVNNSLRDLYHLLCLFAGDGDFADVGVPSLRAAFDDACATCLTGAAPALAPVLRAVMIRRTRSFVRGSAAHPECVLPFPEQRPPRSVRYAIGEPDAVDRIGTGLLRLAFPAHAANAAAPAELMRIGLLKRLESSIHAFHRSIRRYATLLERCRSALERGLLVRARDDPQTDDADDAQLSLDAMLFQPVRSSAARDRYRAELDAELAAVRSLRASSDPARDPKLAALVGLLDGELRGRKVVLFTQFRDTARWLHERLRAGRRVALIDGSCSLLGAEPCDRAGVVRRFAPRSNGGPDPGARETIDVLIATDVLSEGFNLQDASAVVSYDLPWNPIRVVQRVGRVDRLGSAHRAIASYHFLPLDLERYLGLVERVARKAIAIDATVGSDMPLLHASLVRALERGDAEALDRVEREDSGVLDMDERLRRLLTTHRSQARGSVRGRPSTRATGAGSPSGGARPDAGGRSTDTADPVPIGLLPATAAATRSGPSGLVAAWVGSRLEWVALRDGLVSDEAAAAALLERAVTQAPLCGRPANAQVDALLRLARRALTARTAAAAGGALLPAGGSAALLGRRLLGAAAAIPGGPHPVLCARIEGALERLAATPEALLRTLTPGHDLDAMLASIERLPRREGVRHAPVPSGEGLVRIVGVLIEATPDR